MLLKDSGIKKFILEVWAKYKKDYDIKIYDFCILDNHVHMLVKAPNATKLGNFMRVTNSLIARAINKHLGRDSHALRERYKSPVIEDTEYITKLLPYIWLNYYKATKIHPKDYPYGSAFYRMHRLSHPVLDSYESLPIHPGKDEARFVRQLIDAAISKIMSAFYEVFSHSYTIGNASTVESRWREIVTRSRWASG